MDFFQVFLRYFFENIPYLLRRELFFVQIECISFYKVDFSLICVAVWAFLWGIFYQTVKMYFFLVLAHKHPATTFAHYLEEAVNYLDIEHMNHRASKFKIAKMSHAIVKAPAACPAVKPRVDNTKPWVHYPALYWVAVCIVKVRGDDPHSSHLLYRLRRQHMETKGFY